DGEGAERAGQVPAEVVGDGSGIETPGQKERYRYVAPEPDPDRFVHQRAVAFLEGGQRPSFLRGGGGRDRPVSLDADAARLEEEKVSRRKLQHRREGRPRVGPVTEGQDMVDRLGIGLR